MAPETASIVGTVLKWSEVAKGGLSKERADWIKKGYPLDIHNIASAEIYRDVTKDSGLIYTLIKTHGVVGQAIRGEISFAVNQELTKIQRDDLKPLLMALNECIIRAVSEGIWKRVKKSTESHIDEIIKGEIREYSPQHRLQKLCPGEIEFFDNLILLVYGRIAF